MAVDSRLPALRVGAHMGTATFGMVLTTVESGILIETDIPFTMLPEAVRTAFAATEYAAAPCRRRVDMLTNASL